MRAALALASALLALALASLPVAAQPDLVSTRCSSGTESSFCVVTVGPCREETGRNQSGEVTYEWHEAGCTVPVVGDCAASTDSRGSTGAACGPVAAPAHASAPQCMVGLPPHAGFDCTIGQHRCWSFIWIDGNPPNPTLGCVS